MEHLHDQMHIRVVPGYPDSCLCMCARCADPPRPADWVWAACICPDCPCGGERTKRTVNTLTGTPARHPLEDEG